MFLVVLFKFMLSNHLYYTNFLRVVSAKNQWFISSVNVNACITLGPAHNDFGYSESPAMISRFLYINITYIEQFLLYHFTSCKREPVYIRSAGIATHFWSDSLGLSKIYAIRWERPHSIEVDTQCKRALTLYTIVFVITPGFGRNRPPVHIRCAAGIQGTPGHGTIRR